VAVAALASLWSGLATGTEPVPPTRAIATVYIKGGEGGPRFVAPRTVTAGEELRVVDQANPRRVGPDTFSLVAASLIPRTPRARQVCFTKGHICRAIGAWHGAVGDGPPTVNPVEAGAEGWDTEGTLTEKGDSWFTGERPGASIVQRVTAPGGTTIHFVSALHPWMHGSIAVLPAGG
jgi:hypothetical protein